MEVQLESEVLVSGTIIELSPLSHIPRPMVTIHIESYRFKKGAPYADNLKIIVFDDEEFLKKYKIGDRIKIEGELQSRNYRNRNFFTENVYASAVLHYMELFGEPPAEKKFLKKDNLMIIDWDKLLEKKLIPRIPEDSMYRENGVRVKDSGTYVYATDQEGKVYKNRQHVAYEIIATKVQLLKQELGEKEVDLNRVVLHGQLNHAPKISENGLKSAKLEIRTKNDFLNFSCYWHAFALGSLANYIEQKLNKHDFVSIVGRIQSRTYTKEVLVNWRKENGRKMKKVLDNEFFTREISISQIKSYKSIGGAKCLM